jgi:hypothetical protein
LNVRQLVLVGLAALALGGAAAIQVGQAQAQSAPPTPPPPNSLPTQGVLFGTPVPAYSAPPTLAPIAAPSSSAAPQGRGRRHGAAPSPSASPSETPEPPQFSTMDGVWELALQPLSGTGTVYSHLYITQKGDQLSGRWVRGKPGKHSTLDTSDFTGTFDGRLFKLTGTDVHATFTLAGYVENFSDMVGLLTAIRVGADPGATPGPGIPFTAGHRKATKDRGVF